MRRPHSKLYVIIGGLLSLCLIESFVIFNLAQIAVKPFSAKWKSEIKTNDTKTQLESLRREARTKAALYNQLIETNMLVEGMVVGDKDEKGKANHLCDSLLFSSLRYRALVGLGFKANAKVAWDAILLSRDKGHWWRHPLCSQDSLSRDMLMGLMVALESNPPGTRKIVMELLDEISSRGNGSFSDGPFFVSYLSPGPAGLLRRLAEKHNIPSARWPWVLKQSFSSIEFDTPFLKPGYESHLAAMGLWLESRYLIKEKDFNPRSILGQMERQVLRGSPTRVTSVDRSRLIWVSKSLVDANPENMFFQTLEADIAFGMTDEIRVVLLTKLLAMPQFPATQLPQDCHKDADYLWQRKDEGQNPKSLRCSLTYNGVDFLWMAAILNQDSIQDTHRN